MSKHFRLTASQIQELAPGHGSCLASDEITVGGKLVGFMYREAPTHSTDSGWRFLAGTETQAYLDDPDHLELYDVNTIANYDPSILPYLTARIGTAFERDADSSAFHACETPEDLDA